MRWPVGPLYQKNRTLTTTITAGRTTIGGTKKEENKHIQINGTVAPERVFGGSFRITGRAAKKASEPAYLKHDGKMKLPAAP